jgi:3-deoxy-manno-octulosonate cytidylyltransferase (CMP-KDO synthetase)
MPAERVVIVIAARRSARDPSANSLADMTGGPMIRHVWERAREVAEIDEVMVATDDQQVADAVRGFGGRAEMTTSDHPSAADSLAELMARVEAGVFISLPCGEPLMRAADIGLLVRGMRADSSVEVGTLCHPVAAQEARDPEIVKVVLADNGDALYFSRAPIPYPRNHDDCAIYLQHLDIFAYRRAVLARRAALPRPMLERAEKLEQLRLLAAGVRIRAWQVTPIARRVDTPQDPALARLSTADGRPAARSTLADIRLVITDVDGVLTDGGLYYDAGGECLKRFHVRDGLGIRLLEESGVRVAVLSGRDSPALRKRVADLRVTLHSFGVKDKGAACHALMQAAGVTAWQTACTGDDSIDLPAFAVCGFAVAVADAADYVRRRADLVLGLTGGNGAFRELADAILVAQGRREVVESGAGFLAVSGKMSQ